jgi:hypothetical protein
VDLQLGPLSLVNTFEELLERKCRGVGLENRDYCRRGSAALITLLYPQQLALTSPTSGHRSAGIICSWTHATEFVVLFVSVPETSPPVHLFLS